MNSLKSRLFVIACILVSSCSRAAAQSIVFGQVETATIASAAQSNSYTFSAAPAPAPDSAATVNPVYFSDDFENGLSKWTESTGYWGTVTCDYRSTTNGVSATPVSGSTCPPTNYPANVNASLMLAGELNLAGATSPVLTFWHKYSIEATCCTTWDYGFVEYSTNYGVSWTKLSNQDTQSPDANGPGFTGTISSWYPEEFDLTTIPKWNTVPILIRFRLWDGRGGNTSWGWLIDDVEVKEKGTANVGLTVSIPSGGGTVTGGGINCPGTCAELWPANWTLSGREWAAEVATYETPPDAMSAVPDYPSGGNYALYADSVLEQATAVSLAGATAPTLSIYTQYSISATCCTTWDYGFVEYSTDYGLTWTKLSNQDTPKPDGNGPGFTGTVTSWTQEQFDLTQITNWATLPILIRFRLWDSRGGNTGWGWLIDDPEIYDPATGKTYFGPDTFGSGSLPNFSNVTLTATPNSGSTFESWTGCNSTSGNECTINRYIDRVVTATFSSSAPNFTLSANPNSVTITQGGSGTSTITVTDVDGFTGSVGLSASGLPSGVTATFNPTSTTTTSTLTLAATATASTGTGTVTIEGVSGSLTNTTALALTVNPTGVPVVTLTPASLAFGNVAEDETSAAKTVTLKNTGATTLNISSITESGVDFHVVSNTCGATVLAGKSCIVKVDFAPPQLGPFTGNLTIADNASNSPQTVTFTGAGVAQATWTPTSLSFATQAVETTSAAKIVTLTNNLPTALSITGITITGTDTGDFAQTNTCGGSVASKGKCTISVTFTPQATGKRTATLNINDSANNSPQTVSLTGTGEIQVTRTPSSLAFALQTVGTTSAAKNVTLTNNLPTALSITSITFTGTDTGDFAQTNTCGSSVASKGKCTISVTFTPEATGTRTATLNINDSANNSPQTVSLSGTGK